MAAALETDGVLTRPVSGKRDMDRFIRVPWALYREDPNWVPPLMMERRDHLDAGKNPYFKHADTNFWLAERDGRAVGRISAQVNRAHLERYEDAVGHFGFFETVDDPAVAGALIETAAGWLGQRGMTRMRGPLSLSINDESGVLVDG